MKLLWAILVCMNLTLTVWYLELDRRTSSDRELARLTMLAQNEVLAVHARAINDQTRLLVQFAKVVESAAQNTPNLTNKQGKAAR